MNSYGIKNCVSTKMFARELLRRNSLLFPDDKMFYILISGTVK